MKNRSQNLRTDQSGVAVITALGILLLLGMVGLAVDLGYLYVVKTELQRAAEAGAMGGVRALFPDQLEIAPKDLTPRCSDALSTGTSTAQVNKVNGGNLGSSDITVQTGRWDWSSGQFSPGCSANQDNFTNAVTVTARKENVPLFFMQALGSQPVTLTASSTAVMDFVSGLHQGAGFVLVLWKNYAKSGDIKIYLNPDNKDLGGWFSKENPCNAEKIKGYLDNPGGIPALKTGDTIYLDNGVMASALAKLDSDYIGKTVWLPVVDTDKFIQTAPVEGFTAFRISGTGQDEDEGGKKYISGRALTLDEAPGTVSDPGGPDYGLLSSPRLVK
jgi:Flp pilus assembly protein TadG